VIAMRSGKVAPFFMWFGSNIIITKQYLYHTVLKEGEDMRNVSNSYIKIIQNGSV